EFALAPGRTIKGVVRDDATGKPIPGMRLTVDAGGRDAVSGSDGQFELRGVPKSSSYTVHALPTERAAGLANAQPTVSDAAGLADQEVEVKVRKGTPLVVKVVDGSTGKLEAGDVSYRPVFPNKDLPANLWVCYFRLFRQPDGTYRGAALPGPGAVTVR